jgi:hypothetical protein
VAPSYATYREWHPTQGEGIVIATAVNGRALGRGARRKQVSFGRLLWVAPLTVGVSLALNFAIKLVVQALDPTLSHMGHAGRVA